MDERSRGSAGPPPTTEGADPLAELEDWIEGRDRAVSEEHETTADGLRRGASLDERLAEELPEASARSAPQLVDVGAAAEDGRDDEADLIATSAGWAPAWPAPEEAAMRIVDALPGATDHADDLAEG
jgi:hypothetical protein